MEDNTEIQDTAVTEAPAQVEEQAAPVDPPARRALYKKMVADNMYSKSYDEFNKQFSTSEKVAKLHDYLTQKGKYSKDANTFNQQFFPDIKVSNSPVQQAGGQQPPKKKGNGEQDLPNTAPISGSPADTSPQNERVAKAANIPSGLPDNFVNPTGGNLSAPPNVPVQDAQAVSAQMNKEYRVNQQKQAAVQGSNIQKMLTDYAKSHNIDLKKKKSAYDIRFEAESEDPTKVNERITKQHEQDQKDNPDFKGSFIEEAAAEGKVAHDVLNKGLFAMVTGLVTAANFIAHILPTEFTPETGNDKFDKAKDDVNGYLGQLLKDTQFESKDGAIGISPQTVKSINKSPLLGTANQLLGIVPQVAAAESTGGLSYYYGGVGNAQNTLDDLKKKGVKISPEMEGLYTQASGISNMALMKLVESHAITNAISPSLRNSIVGDLSLQGMKNLSDLGENATTNDILQAMKNPAIAFDQRLKQFGVDAIKNYPKVAADLTAFTAADHGITTLANKMNEANTGGEPTIQQEDLGDQVRNLLFSSAPALAAFGTGMKVLEKPGLLFNDSPYSNIVVENLYKDSSPENVDNIKSDIATILKDKGVSDDEIHNTQQAVDVVADIANKLPRTMPVAKYKQGVDIIGNRRKLEATQQQFDAERSKLDPSLQGSASKFDELILAKIDQANDQLSTLVSDKPFTYFEHQGEYFKVQQDSKPIKITKARYDLEGVDNHRESLSPESVIMPEGTADAKGNPIPVKENEKPSESKPVEAKVPEKPAEVKPVAEAKPVKANDVPVEDNSENLEKIGSAFKKRFGTNYKVITPEEAQDFLNKNHSKGLFFQILDDVDLFNSTDPQEAKKFIDRVFNTVDNESEAKTAYRKLAVKYHPDKGGNEDVFKYLNNVNDSFKSGKKPIHSDDGSNENERTDQFRQATEDFIKNSKVKWEEQQRETARQINEMRTKLNDIEYRKRTAINQVTKKFNDLDRSAKSEYDETVKNINKKSLFKKSLSPDEIRTKTAEARKKLNDTLRNNQGNYKYAVESFTDVYASEASKVRKSYGYSFQKGDDGKVGGFYDKETNTAYLVNGVADDTTAIHELFSHPFIQKIEKEHPELFANLLDEALDDDQVKAHVDSKYADADERTKNHEYIAAAIDLEAKGQLKNKRLIDFINELWETVKKYIKDIFGSNQFDKNSSIKDIVDFVLKKDTPINLEDNAKPESPEVVTPKANNHGKEGETEAKGQGRQDVLSVEPAAAEVKQSPADSKKRNKVSDTDAPTVEELSRNLKETGKPGISIEPSYERAYEKPNALTGKELDNGNKYVVSRDNNGKINGTLEISYQAKDGIHEKPVAVKVAVDEGSRRKGIATALFKHAEDNGIDLSDVRGRETTDGGQALYEANSSKSNSLKPRNSGELENEGLSHAELDKKAIESETDPAAIASRYHTESNNADYIEQGVMDYFGKGKINEQDYNRWGDRNNLGDKSDPKRRRWIDSKNSDRVGLDQHAEILSDELGVHVTPEDIIGVIDKYDSPDDFNERNKSDTQTLLEQRYEELTGNRLTPKRAEKAFNESHIVKRLNKEEEDNFNKYAKQIGITNEDVDNYEQYIKETEPGRNNPGDTGSIPGKISEPENDKGGSGNKGDGDKEPQEPLGGREKAQQEYDQQKKAFDDFIKNSRKVAGAFANIGEFAIKAARLLAAYAKLGMYKFADMLADLRKKYGDEFVDENIDGLKQAYGLAKAEFSGDELAKFDTDNSVLAYTTDAGSLKIASNKKKSFDTAAKNKTNPDELMGVFAAIDPRQLTPDEVRRYNGITAGKSINQINRDEAAIFIDDVHQRQDDQAAEREKQWYKQLDNDPDFEGTDLKKTLADVGKLSGDETDLSETKPNETAKEALKKILAFGRGELRKVEDTPGMEAVKKALLDLDESKLSSRNLRDMNRAIESIINDNNYAGTGKWVALQESVGRAAGILAAKNKAGFETGKTSKIPSQLRSLPLNTEIMVKDSKLASVVQERSGIFDISAGNARVNVTMNKITKQFTELTDKMGKDIMSVENRYKRGVLATFTQKAESDTPESHFERYKDYVETTARRLKRSTRPSERKEADLVQDIYDNYVKPAASSADVVAALTKENPNNAKIVKFFIDKHQEIYPQLRQSALLYSGKELPLIENYTSTNMKMLRGAEERPIGAEAIIDPVSMDDDDKPRPTDTGQSRTTISRKRTMGPKRVMNLNFDALQLNKLRESHYDVQTLPSRHLYNAMRSQPDFKEALGNSQTNVNVLSDGVATMVEAQRGFNRTDPVARMVLNASDLVTSAAVRIAIAGVDQFVKHYPARAINTMGNLGADIDLYFKSVSMMDLNNPIFNESAIALRGLSKGGLDVESGIRNMQKYDFSTFGSAMNAVNKFYGGIDKVVASSLTTADELVARHSWRAYYMQDLRRRGVDINTIDWENEHKKVDKEAAAYAEQMVSRNEIPNDPTQRAVFDQRGNITNAKELIAEIAKKLAAPFTGYSRNIQARIENDIRKFYGGNRKEAAISLAATTAETASFQSFKILLKIAYGVAAGYILTHFDYDPPKTKPGWDQLPAETVDDMLLAGTGSMADNMIKKGVNSAYQLATGKEKSNIFKNYDPAMYGQTDFSAWGMYGILPEKVHSTFEAFPYMKGEVHGEVDGYDRRMGAFTQDYETELTKRQQHLATAVFLLDLSSTLGISEASSQRLNFTIFNAMKRQSEPVTTHLDTRRNKQSGSVKAGPKDFGDE